MYDALGMLMPTAIHAALQHADAQHLEELQFGIRQLTQKEHTLYELNGPAAAVSEGFRLS
ncbi:MAG: hypothetical protein ACLRL6_06170 [Clostridium sp.]